MAIDRVSERVEASGNSKKLAMSGVRSIRGRVMMTTALTVPALFGYGTRQAYAACVNSGGSTYLCSGNETTGQTINTNNADVTMGAGATVDTTGGVGDAIAISGNGNLRFTNNDGGAISGANRGLRVQTGGAVGGGTLEIDTTQAISGGSSDGIFASNASTGHLTINAATVTSTNNEAIRANINNSLSNGVLSITASGAVSGYAGIYGVQGGRGALTIDAASVTGTGGVGIHGVISNGSSSADLSITATGAVSGTQGIRARQLDDGGLTINAASVTGTSNTGIYALSNNTSGSGAVSVTAMGTVSGAEHGIEATQKGSGGLTINAASVTSTAANRDGIRANMINTAATGDLSVTATGHVRGGFNGVYARNNGTGKMSVNVASVEATAAFSDGIWGVVTNAGAGDVSITASGTVSGGRHGIGITQPGTGSLTINAASTNGGTGSGIQAEISNVNSMAPLSVTSTGTSSGGDWGINAQHRGLGALTIDAASATAGSSQGVLGIVHNANSMAALNIATSGMSKGAIMGVTASHYGLGTVTVNAASANGVSGDGLNVGVQNAASSADMSINATGAISGGRFGILAIQNGSGAADINIAAGASVTGGFGAISTNSGTQLGTDTVTNAGTINGYIDLADGTNVVNNLAGGVITGDLLAGAGNDTFSNDGTFTGTASLGGGTNVVSNTSHTTFNGSLITGAGDDTVTNTGTWNGIVNLGGGTNAFNNNAGGIFAGSTVSVGVGNVFTNAGTVSPGGAGAIGTTVLTGNYVQTAEGILAVDVDPTGPTTDLLTVSGTAELAGSVLPTFSPDATRSGEVTVLTAAGGVTDNGLSIANSATVNYELKYPDANNVVLSYAINFARTAADLTQNQTALGEYLNRILEAGGTNLTALLTPLIGITDTAQYRAALDQLQGEHQQNQSGMLFGTNRAFVNSLLSCPERLDGNEKAMADETCIWSRVDGRTTDVDRSNTTVGGDETVWGFSGGYETAIPGEEQVRVGAMFSVEDIQSDSNSGASSDGRRFRAGVKAEKGFGDLELSAGLFGGITNYDTNRPTFGGAVAQSDHDITFASMVGRVSYSWDAGPVRVVPMLDLIATHLDFEEVNETGAGAANLRIEGNEEWIVSATPALGVVGTVAETEDVKVHASLKGGVSFYSKSELTFRSNFIAAPVGIGGFTTTSGFDDVVGNVSGALQFELNEGLSIKAGYDGRFGDLSTSHGGYVRAAMPF